MYAGATQVLTVWIAGINAVCVFIGALSGWYFGFSLFALGIVYFLVDYIVRAYRAYQAIQRVKSLPNAVKSVFLGLGVIVSIQLIWKIYNALVQSAINARMAVREAKGNMVEAKKNLSEYVFKAGVFFSWLGATIKILDSYLDLGEIKNSVQGYSMIFTYFVSMSKYFGLPIMTPGSLPKEFKKGVGDRCYCMWRVPDSKPSYCPECGKHSDGHNYPRGCLNTPEDWGYNQVTCDCGEPICDHPCFYHNVHGEILNGIVQRDNNKSFYCHNYIVPQSDDHVEPPVVEEASSSEDTGKNPDPVKHPKPTSIDDDINVNVNPNRSNDVGIDLFTSSYIHGPKGLEKDDEYVEFDFWEMSLVEKLSCIRDATVDRVTKKAKDLKEKVSPYLTAKLVVVIIFMLVAYIIYWYTTNPQNSREAKGKQHKKGTKGRSHGVQNGTKKDKKARMKLSMEAYAAEEYIRWGQDNHGNYFDWLDKNFLYLDDDWFSDFLNDYNDYPDFDLDDYLWETRGEWYDDSAWDASTHLKWIHREPESRRNLRDIAKTHKPKSQSARGLPKAYKAAPGNQQPKPKKNKQPKLIAPKADSPKVEPPVVDISSLKKELLDSLKEGLNSMREELKPKGAKPVPAKPVKAQVQPNELRSALTEDDWTALKYFIQNRQTKSLALNGHDFALALNAFKKQRGIKQNLKFEPVRYKSLFKREGGPAIPQPEIGGMSVKTFHNPHLHDEQPPPQPLDELPEITAPKGPGKEAKVSGSILIETCDARSKQQGHVFYGTDDDWAGWFSIYDIEEGNGRAPYILIPKHFITDAKARNFDFLRLASSTQQVKISLDSFKVHDQYDMASFKIPENHPMCSLLKHITALPFDLSKPPRMATIFVERQKKMIASATQRFGTHQGDGEYAYWAETARGDCGVPVWTSEGVIGFHVGTNGEDRGNRWLPISQLVLDWVVKQH
jgi:hypothetical protein